MEWVAAVEVGNPNESKLHDLSKCHLSFLGWAFAIPKDLGLFSEFPVVSKTEKAELDALAPSGSKSVIPVSSY
jgi:hypothetical protein